MMQVTKVWWDGEKLMAEPIDPTTIYQEPAQEKDWGAVGDAHIAAIKKSSKAMVEDAVVRAAQKVMAEFEAKSDERLMEDWGPGPHECRSLPERGPEQPAQQEPMAWIYSHGKAKVVSVNYVPGVRATPLYTSPPAQRTWVGLTDTERNSLWREIMGWGDPSHDDEDLMKAIEDASRRKNT